MTIFLLVAVTMFAAQPAVRVTVTTLLQHTSHPGEICLVNYIRSYREEGSVVTVVGTLNMIYPLMRILWIIWV